MFQWFGCTCQIRCGFGCPAQTGGPGSLCKSPAAPGTCKSPAALSPPCPGNPVRCHLPPALTLLLASLSPEPAAETPLRLFRPAPFAPVVAANPLRHQNHRGQAVFAACRVSLRFLPYGAFPGSLPRGPQKPDGPVRLCVDNGCVLARGGARGSMETPAARRPGMSVPRHPEEAVTAACGYKVKNLCERRRFITQAAVFSFLHQGIYLAFMPKGSQIGKNGVFSVAPHGLESRASCRFSCPVRSHPAVSGRRRASGRIGFPSG